MRISSSPLRDVPTRKRFVASPVSGAMRLRCVWPLIAAMTASHASAQNLVDNGGFAGGASGWRVSGEGSWSSSSDDIDDDPASGSVWLRNEETTAGTRTHPLDQCITIEIPGEYLVGGSVRVGAGQPTGYATLSTSVFTGSACDTGFFTGNGRAMPRTQTWTSVEFIQRIDNVPATLLIRVGVDKPGADGTLEVQADDIYLLRTDRLFRNGFE